MIFQNAVPILYSSDVAKSLAYYTDVLGFESKWDWETPPTFGGVHKDTVEIFFCKEGQGSPGTWLCITVDDVDTFHEEIKSRGATILAEPKNMEWGMREMVVGDPDGHRIRFGQRSFISDRKKSEASLSKSVRIVKRAPLPNEMHQLMLAVGWTSTDKKPNQELSLTAVAFVVVAEEIASGKVIGCAFLLTDHAGFYYVKNVLVHPDWQSKRIGSAMMQELRDWLDKHAPANAFVALHTAPNMEPFYRQFGFAPSFSMVCIMHPKGNK
jgi:catechol 2,3-dioxygenase-like lactoylglutathione lyase family enzyme/N-acetylglutamate synthase-like GNAT family acetyltransferase